MSLSAPKQPQSSPSIAILADAHLGGPGGSGAELIIQLEQLSSQNCHLLLLLGDLFHVWVGDRRFETAEIRNLLPVLKEVGRRGVPMVYVEGNRDFFLGNSPYSRLFDAVVNEHSFELGGTRYLAVHGDGLNDRDWRYRFWRRLSKNTVSRRVMFSLPRWLARYAVLSTEKRLAQTNFEHKIHLPADVIGRYAQRRLGEGHDVLLLGHFHQERCWKVAGGEVRILDAWYNNRQLQWLFAA